MLIREGERLLYKGEPVEVVRVANLMVLLGREDGHTFTISFIELVLDCERVHDADELASRIVQKLHDDGVVFERYVVKAKSEK